MSGDYKVRNLEYKRDGKHYNKHVLGATEQSSVYKQKETVAYVSLIKCYEYPLGSTSLYT